MRQRKGTAVTGPDGQLYQSCAAAARALGFHVSTVRYHIAVHGNLTFLGSGCVPCEKDGITYPSLKACATALGLKRHTLNHHLEKHGNLDRAGNGKAEGNPGNRGKRRFTRIGPLEWPRRKDAAADLGISMTSLNRWLSPNATPTQREKMMAIVMGVQMRRDQAARKRA